MPFWIDSICVPLASEGRKLAISRMRDVYKLADKVLVLDSLLYESPSDIDIKEVAFRVYASDWAMRLWTLQEVGLAAPPTNYNQINLYMSVCPYDNGTATFPSRKSHLFIARFNIEFFIHQLGNEFSHVANR